MKDKVGAILRHGVEDSRSGRARKPRRLKPRLGRKRIMLVESNSDFGTMISCALTAETDYDLHWVQNPADLVSAMQAQETWPPDLLLLDVTRLMTDYKDQLGSLARGEIDCPPIIMMSDWTPGRMETVVSKVKTEGVTVKPFDIQSLLDSIRCVLGDYDVYSRATQKMAGRANHKQDAWGASY